MNDEKPVLPAAFVLIEAAVHALRQQGITTASDIACALNGQGVSTPGAKGSMRGKSSGFSSWHDEASVAPEVVPAVKPGMSRADSAVGPRELHRVKRSQPKLARRLCRVAPDSIWGLCHFRL